MWSFSLVSDNNVTFQKWMTVNDLLDVWPHLIHCTTIKSMCMASQNHLILKINEKKTV